MTTSGLAMNHSRLGVWDLYQRPPTKKARLSLRPYLENAPYVWHMLKDVLAIPYCKPLLAAYLLLDLLASLVPALSLAYQGQLLSIVQTAVDSRTVDPHALVTAVAGGFLASLATRVLRYAKQRVATPLHARIKLHYSVHIFSALVRLDVPTFDDPVVQSQIDAAVPKQASPSVPWQALSTATHVVATVIQLASQLSVLVAVLRDQPDGPLLAVLCFALAFFKWNKSHKQWVSTGVWAATTTDADYIKAEGLKRTVANPAHRKEIVAGGIAPYLLSQYRTAVSRLSTRSGDFYEAVAADARSREAFSTGIILHELLRVLPEIIFALRALHSPLSLPRSLASLALITQTTQSFAYALLALADEAGGVRERMMAVRSLYEVGRIRNLVGVVEVGEEGKNKGNKEKGKGQKKDKKAHVDKDEEEDEDARGLPFPEDSNTLAHGIRVEFRNVSFAYPGQIDPVNPSNPLNASNTQWALRNISFTLHPGQLCVIVGNNGSGKSTVLKLLARLYDPSEGSILLNGRDIRTLRLRDVRRAVSVLFQDYTVFPLSIRDNIALGAPVHPDFEHDPHNPNPNRNPTHNRTRAAQLETAARLGGALPLIERLPEGWDTYLERPVQDYFSAGAAADGGRLARRLLPRRGRANPKTNSNGSSSSRGLEEEQDEDVDLDLEDVDVDVDADEREEEGYGSSRRGVSGGQMQRIALSRTFMRSVVADNSVGLLLFDEPSASLDPTAEHDLFERLRTLRGNKTMVFSSHRFGNLTRHADVILYMHDSVIVEAGTHDELLARGGEYARIWNLQARAFL